MSQQNGNGWGPPPQQQQQQWQPQQQQQQGFGTQNPNWQPPAQGAPTSWAPQAQQPQQGWGPPQQQQQQQQQQQPAPSPAAKIDGTSMWSDDWSGVSQAAVAQAQREQVEAEARRSGGVGGREFKPLGPNGETKWSEIPWRQGMAPYTATYRVWFIGKPDGSMPFDMDVSHFYKSRESPGGAGCACLGGKDLCPVCFARSLLWKSGNKQDAELAEKWKVRRTGLFQLILVDHHQQHQTPQGTLEPLWWRAPNGVTGDIEKILRQPGGGRLLHPIHGRPWTLSKTKTGPMDMDIEWDCAPTWNPEPLHQFFQPVFQNLIDMTKFKRRPNPTEMAKTIQQCGYPFTNEVAQMLQKVAVDFPEPPPLSQQQQQWGPPPGQQGWQQQQGQQGGYGQQPSWQPGPGQNPNGGHYDQRQQMADQVRGGGGGGGNGRW